MKKTVITIAILLITVLMVGCVSTAKITTDPQTHIGKVVGSSQFSDSRLIMLYLADGRRILADDYFVGRGQIIIGETYEMVTSIDYRSNVEGTIYRLIHPAKEYRKVWDTAPIRQMSQEEIENFKPGITIKVHPGTWITE